MYPRAINFTSFARALEMRVYFSRTSVEMSRKNIFHIIARINRHECFSPNLQNQAIAIKVGLPYFKIIILMSSANKKIM